MGATGYLWGQLGCVLSARGNGTFFFSVPERAWIQILALALKRHGALFSRLSVLLLPQKPVQWGLEEAL